MSFKIAQLCIRRFALNAIVSLCVHIESLDQTEMSFVKVEVQLGGVLSLRTPDDVTSTLKR